MCDVGRFVCSKGPSGSWWRGRATKHKHGVTSTSDVHPPHIMRCAAYLWSPELMAVADALPANQGRSRTVHGLVRALGLADFAAVQEYATARSPSAASESEEQSGEEELEHDTEACQPEERGIRPSCIADGLQEGCDEEKTQPADSRCSIRTIAPDPVLCEAAELRRYHDAGYVGACGARPS